MGTSHHICHFMVKEVVGDRGYGQIISQILPRFSTPLRAWNSNAHFTQRWDEFLLHVLSAGHVDGAAVHKASTLLHYVGNYFQ